MGWIWESCYVSLKKRKPVNRGFLNGPVIPIYGAGATVIYLAFYNPVMLPLVAYESVSGYVLIFFIGMVAASVLEFVTSYVMEKLFHAKWWDYSDQPLNIQGRICFFVSLFWGALSIILVKFLHPEMSKLVAAIPRLPGEIAGYVILVLFLADFAVTVAVTVQLDQKINTMQKLREEVYELAYGLKFYEAKEELKGRLSKYRLSEFRERRRQWIQELMEERPEMNELSQEWKEFAESVSERADEFEAKTKAVFEKHKATTAGIQRFIFKRIFNAFPTMRVNGREEAVLDLKEHLQAYKQKREAKRVQDKKE